jgi:NTP pyrophosphatase (non-canonical NTP hydrolase)
MELNDYQAATQDTAIYPGKGTELGLYYAALGLGEAGEVQGKIKKILRDDGGKVSEDKRIAILAELGDLLWYIAAATTELNANLSDVAENNIAKLASRKERGVLGGSGDDR